MTFSVSSNSRRSKGSGDLVDLVGIEPTTSSMPFLIFDWSGATRRKYEAYWGAVFMRV